MKYKPCCEKRCLLAGCKTRDAGGCYCVCRLVDEINTMKGVIDGTCLDYGSMWIPDKNKRKEYFDRKRDEEKEKHEAYRTIEAPEILKNLEESLKKYEDPNFSEHP